jgi:hypothetical protein
MVCSPRNRRTEIYIFLYLQIHVQPLVPTGKETGWGPTAGLNAVAKMKKIPSQPLPRIEPQSSSLQPGVYTD